MKRVVSESLDAVVRLEVESPGRRRTVVDAIVDTGFNSYLTLPADVIRRLGLPCIGEGGVTLADGASSTLRVFQGFAAWDGARRPIDILEADGGPLLGMGMMLNHELRVEVRGGGSVSNSALPS